MMHCFGHIHEGHGVEAISWKKPLTVKPPPRKNEAVHRFFEDENENPYPQPFMWTEGHGDQTLAVNAALMS